jgi:methanogenic corrinoid protein MtbC1
MPFAEAVAGPPENVPVSELRERYLAAQLAGDRREGLRLIVREGLGRGAPVETLLELIRGCQEEIGRLWELDRITIAQEHMATAISQLTLSHLYQHARPTAANGKKVLVGCVEGELHDFPARLAADALDLAGFDVRFLGANVPDDSLLSLEAEAPDMLALSVTMTFNVPALRDAVTRVRARWGASLPIAIGGHACSFAGDMTSRIGADGSASDGPGIVSLARRLAGMAP